MPALAGRALSVEQRVCGRGRGGRRIAAAVTESPLRHCHCLLLLAPPHEALFI